MSNVRDTSRDAYQQVNADGTIMNHRQRLLLATSNGQAYTRNELAELTGIRIPSVCGAVHTMVKRGLLLEGEPRLCKITGFPAHTLARPLESAP